MLTQLQLLYWNHAVACQKRLRTLRKIKEDLSPMKDNPYLQKEDVEKNLKQVDKQIATEEKSINEALDNMVAGK